MRIIRMMIKKIISLLKKNEVEKIDRLTIHYLALHERYPFAIIDIHHLVEQYYDHHSNVAPKLSREEITATMVRKSDLSEMEKVNAFTYYDIWLN